MNNRTTHPNDAPRSAWSASGKTGAGSRMVDGASEIKRVIDLLRNSGFTPEQDEMIRSIYRTPTKESPTIPEVAAAIGVSKYQIRQRAEALGLAKKQRQYTTREDAIIRQYYPTEGAHGCAKRLKGRTVESAHMRAKHIGVKCIVALNTGNRNGRTKIPEEYVPVVRNQHDKIWPGLKMEERAARLGISKNHFRRIRNGLTRNSILLKKGGVRQI